MPKDQPADPGRRQFFRRLGHETAVSAGRAVGVADSMRRGGTVIAGEILGLGLGEPQSSSLRLEGLSQPALPSSFSSAYRYTGDLLVLLDQRALPDRRAEIACAEASEIAAAFRAGVASGPILGEIAAYALVLTANMADGRPPAAASARMEAAAATLAGARPNVRAVRWAVDRMMSVVRAATDRPAALLHEAESIASEAGTAHAELGRSAAAAFASGDGSPLQILLHGDMGPLSCGLVGTGFAVVQSLIAAGTSVHVYVTEGGPRSEGARVSTLQLAQLDVPHTIVDDAAVAWLLDSRPVDAALIRADAVFANGDCAGPLGTANVARLCAAAGVPAYACATTAAIEPLARDGVGIALDVAEPGRIEPLTDVAPAALLAGLLSERGLLRPPFAG